MALLIGAFLIIWAFGRRNHRLRLLEKGITVEAEVVDIERVVSNNPDGVSYQYKPVVKFPVSKANMVTKTYSISSYPCPYKVGDKLNVSYDPANIDDFTLNDGPAKFLEIFLFGFGIAALIYVAVQFFTTHPAT